MLYSNQTLDGFLDSLNPMTLLEQHDTRVDDKVKVKKRKKRKKHLFKLSAMNKLVDENSFLKNKYDKLSAGAEEKLGYHWNEVVQNILFNKYVKPEETLMGRYLEIKRRDEAEHEAEKKAEHPASAEQAPSPPPPKESGEGDAPSVEAPADGIPDAVVPPAPAPNDPLDTRITTESTDTFSAGNYQHSGPLVTTKGGMNAWMSHWKSKIKNDKSGMTIIQETHNMVQNAFKKLNESGNPLANPALLNILFEEFDQEGNGNQEPTSFHDTFIVASNGQIISNIDSKEPEFYGAVAQILRDKAQLKPSVVKMDELKVDPNDDNSWVISGHNPQDSKPGDEAMFETEVGTAKDVAHNKYEKGVVAADHVFNRPEDRKRDADFDKLVKDEPIVAADAKHLTQNLSVHETDSLGMNAQHVGPLAKGKASFLRESDTGQPKAMKGYVPEAEEVKVDPKVVKEFGREDSAPKVVKEGEAKPAALVQLDRLHKETEKASNGYYKKDQAERNLNMKTMADGSSVQQHDYDSDSMKHEDVPMHHPSSEEENYVKLNRGGNLADRAIQGIKDMPKPFLDRMKDEAGEDVVKDALDKKAEIEKVKPALAPPARTQIVKESVELISEGVVLTARYITPSKRSVIAFNTNRAEKINALNENFTPLETKGFGNDSTPGAKSIIAENDFFIDLGTNQVYVLEKKAGSLNESVQIKKSEHDRMMKLLTYNPSTWSGTKRY